MSRRFSGLMGGGVCLTLSLFLSLPVQATEWQIDPAHSMLSFIGQQAGKSFTGHFNRFDGKINLDPTNLETASLSVTVNMTEFDAHDADRNSALPGADWFHLSRFPEAVFESQTIYQLEDGTYLAEGQLTIKGITQDIDLPFSLQVERDQAEAEGEVILNRMDYGIGEGQWASDRWISHAVRVSYKIHAHAGEVE